MGANRQDGAVPPARAAAEAAAIKSRPGAASPASRLCHAPIYGRMSPLPFEERGSPPLRLGPVAAVEGEQGKGVYGGDMAGSPRFATAGS
jgi:hypothetical protein